MLQIYSRCFFFSENNPGRSRCHSFPSMWTLHGNTHTISCCPPKPPENTENSFTVSFSVRTPLRPSDTSQTVIGQTLDQLRLSARLLMTLMWILMCSNYLPRPPPRSWAFCWWDGFKATETSKLWDRQWERELQAWGLRVVSESSNSLQLPSEDTSTVVNHFILK